MTTLQDIMGLITKRKIKTPKDNDYIISAAYTDTQERLKPQPKMEANLLSIGAIKNYILSSIPIGGSQTLAQTLVIGNNTGGTDILLNSTDAIQLENGSSVEKGTYDFGADGGVSRICGVGYEDMWQSGIRHVFDSNGLIRHSTNCFEIIPDNTFDNSKRFKFGSLWTLDDGTTYRCLDDSLGAAIWELYSSPIPKYKVFTAILSQDGSNNWVNQTSGTFTKGVTYTFDTYLGIDDFSNIGGPPAAPYGTWDGYSFIATGTTPLVYTNSSSIDHNTGAPVVSILENTIGRIWFTYNAEGIYRCYSDNLFEPDKTTVFISDTINKDNPTDRLQLRVLCAPDKQNQPTYLNIFSGTVGLVYEDNVISDNGALRYGVSFEIRVYN